MPVLSRNDEIGNIVYTPNLMPSRKDGSVWPALVEKAYAKMKVNYANLSFGWPYESFRTLTNMPVGTY